MGRMRSSNWEDARNFHFLMIVQMMAVPAMQDATTMNTVSVVRLILEDDAEAVAEADAEASEASVVIVTLGLTEVGMTAVVGATGVGV